MFDAASWIIGSTLPGSVSSVLVTGVRHLDPAPAAFEAMLEGWTRQQRSRFLRVEATLKPQVELVHRFVRFSNQYPWQWTPGELEAFVVSLSASVSTARNYQNSLRMFCDYITDARYGWPGECLERFGTVPQQVLHAWNTVTHTSGLRRPRRPAAVDL